MCPAWPCFHSAPPLLSKLPASAFRMTHSFQNVLSSSLKIPDSFSLNTGFAVKNALNTLRLYFQKLSFCFHQVNAIKNGCSLIAKIFPLKIKTTFVSHLQLVYLFPLERFTEAPPNTALLSPKLPPKMTLDS